MRWPAGLLPLLAPLWLAGCGGGEAQAPREADPPPPQPGAPSVSASPFSAVLDFQTGTAARVRVEYGLAERLGLFSSAEEEPARRHQIVLDGLAPGRSWAYRILVDGAVTKTGTFATRPLPDRSLPVRAVSGHLQVDGNLFFPILQIGQCPRDYPKSRAVGINVFVGREQDCGVDDEELVDAAQAAGALAVVHFEEGIPGRPGLLGYNLRDEPDSLGFPPEAVDAERDAAHAGDPKHPTFITLSRSLNPEFDSRVPAAEREAVYRAYASSADVVGVDVYPHWTLCDDSYLPAVAATQKLLSGYTENPTFQWIETAAANNVACSGERAVPVSPEEMQAEVWMAVTNGATGIGYFTHTWTDGHDSFDVAPAMQEALRETNDELSGLAAALFGAAVPVAVSAPGVDVITRERNGALYVVAVNKTKSEQPVRFRLTVGRRQVLDWRSGERLDPDPSGFAATLGPLAYGIYVLPPILPE